MPTRSNQNDKPEEVPTAAERASFYGGATREAMNDRGNSQAQRDNASVYGTGTVSGHAILRTVPEIQSDIDKAQMRRVADYASRAAAYGDVATGRKKAIPEYKHGGIVPRTGPALLHKGEEVIPKEARDILGGAGAKLHAHEVHIRHTAEKGKYIAKHILKDKDGNAPTDGQRGEAEYSLGSPEEMMDHLHQHMVAPDQDDEESPAAEQG